MGLLAAAEPAGDGALGLGSLVLDRSIELVDSLECLGLGLLAVRLSVGLCAASLLVDLCDLRYC